MDAPPPSSRRATSQSTHLRDSEFWSQDQYVRAGEAIGATRTQIEAPVEVPMPYAMRRGHGIWRAEDYAGLKSREVRGPGFTLLRDVYLMSPGMVQVGDGRYVYDDQTRLTPWGLSRPHVLDLSVGARRRSAWPLAGPRIKRGILIGGPGHMVFGHQLIDYLPAFAMLDEGGLFEDWPLLLPSTTPAWVVPMIELFSSAKRKIKWFSAERQKRTRVEKLCVPWVVRKPAFHPSVAGMFERVAAVASRIGSAERYGPRVSIVRHDLSGKRQLTNSADVLTLLAEHGLRAVRPETLRFAEQVRLFAGAEVVAGEAGSSLHGAVFGSPALATVEIRPDNYGVLGQPAIAVLKRQTFTSVEGSSAGTGPSSGYSWTVDLETLEHRLCELGI